MEKFKFSQILLGDKNATSLCSKIISTLLKLPTKNWSSTRTLGVVIGSTLGPTVILPLVCSTSYMAPPLHTDEKHICAKGDAICIPSNYSKFDLPDESLTTVNVGIDIKDIPKIDDKEFSITLNAFFVVRWTDKRMIIDQVSFFLLPHV